MKLSDCVKGLEHEVIIFRRTIISLKDQVVEITLELKSALKIMDLNKNFRRCPFPYDCNEYDSCNSVDWKTDCSYDVCSNGHCYRMS